MNEACLTLYFSPEHAVLHSVSAFHLSTGRMLPWPMDPGSIGCFGSLLSSQFVSGHNKSVQVNGQNIVVLTGNFISQYMQQQVLDKNRKTVGVTEKSMSNKSLFVATI